MTDKSEPSDETPVLSDGASSPPAVWNDQAGGWYFRARRCRQESLARQFMGWCAKTPDLRKGPLEMSPSAGVRFAFAASPEEAIRKLKAEVLS